MTDAARGRVVGALIVKELREVLRDGRYRLLVLAMLGLVLVTLGFSHREAERLRAERAAAQQVADEHFVDQGAKNPHVAAHYGTYVFKPSDPLAAINPGVDAFVGVSLKLEAHKRNAMQGARARDGTALSRFSRLSVSSVIELLLPLLIIALGYGSWSAEREQGTLRQVASLGVPPSRMLLGKALALALVTLSVLLPAALCVVLFYWLGSGAGELAAGSAARLGTLLGAYVVYCSVWLLLTLWVSAKAASSRSALVALLALWVVTSLIVPRLATDVAMSWARVPSHAEMSEQVRASLADGLPGGEDRETRVSALSQSLLEQQGFAGAEGLMDDSLLSGIELQAEALFENEALDFHFSRYEAQLRRQEQAAQLVGALSPLLSVRAVGMSLAGTDAAHHRRFAQHAELHRRSLVAVLNREFAERGGSAGFSYQAGREVWEKAPKFDYQAPPLGVALHSQLIALAALGGWLLVCLYMSLRGARGISVI